MRPSSRQLLGVALLALITCSGLDTFEIEESATAQIPGASLLEDLVGELGFGSFLNLDISQNQELKNQGVEKEQIDSVHLTTVRLRITDPPAQDFTFLEELEFWVSSEGLERKLIARGGPFPANASTVELEIPTVDLAAYVAAEAMDITTEASGRRPPEDTTIEATLELAVDVNVEGVLCGE